MLPFPLAPDQVWIVYLDQEEIWEGRDDAFFLEQLPSHAHGEALAPSRREKRRERILARSLTHWVLSSALAMEPDGLKISISDHGKPFLAGEDHAGAPAFNLSHSGRLMALALGAPGPLGIDVEDLHRRLNLEVAHRFFSPDEQAQLNAASPSRRSHLFLTFWTLKEAYVKALGSGIAGQDLAGFGFDLAASRFHGPCGDGLSRGKVDGGKNPGPPCAGSWQFCHGRFGKESYMALALKGRGGRPKIKTFKWLGDAIVPGTRWQYDIIPG